jgi:hypothetical protein
MQNPESCKMLNHAKCFQNPAQKSVILSGDNHGFIVIVAVEGPAVRLKSVSLRF